MNAPQTIYLKDYAPPTWLVDTVDLDIAINDGFALVSARLAMRRNPDAAAGALLLDGEDLHLESIRIDGRPLGADEYAYSGDKLTITSVPDDFVLETVVRIEPDKNTQLSGLYRSKDGYFTQCEAQGFRRITFYPDRPDVMARFTCTLHADKSRFPVLLSNGNPVAQGDEDGGRHWAKWQDPFAKPAYLFACVAAKLEVVEDTYVTTSGRRVRCAVYVEPGKLDQCAHALAALKLSMKWDEDVFGLEMDLEHYMIVAVGDFNMGAMENKGLNIFNTKFVLARPDTATDTDYQNIDRVVAHEYFHNWTGNRVTCRDWFQLSLKEGLTVFRDQNFGMDVHSAGVTRIQEVRTLRAAQYPEDAGPMAHPIRPASYAEINNFYTATVYEKGAEVIRMIHTLIGKDAFRKGMDLYFARHDGQAVTCEDFVAAMQDASGLNLDQFQRWYNQAGTPKLIVRSSYDAAGKRYTLDVEQQYPATPYEERMTAEGNGIARGPYYMPLVLGLLDAKGNELPLRLAGEERVQGTQCTLSIRKDKQRFVFADVDAEPVPSLLRGFSAPVVLDYPYSNDELTHLMAFDSDAVNRWEAAQRLATGILLKGIAAPSVPADTWIPESYVEAMRRLLASAFTADGDPALVAEALVLPAETYLAEQMEVVEPDAIHLARLALRQHLAQALREPLLKAYHDLKVDRPYSPDSEQAGKRALRNVCLSYLAELGDEASHALVLAHYEQAANMTDTMAALAALANLDVPARHSVLDAFYARWKGEALVVDKWLQVQSTSRLPNTGSDVRALMAHEAFDIRNPNKVYALVRAFCAANPKHFHAADGSGYKLAADVILQLDPLNPQVASRIARTFDRWKKFDPARQAKAREQLERIKAQVGLSSDVAEVVGKALD
ncbi:aminopeptidase N [Uliginosibacterium sp. H3]|uniref:Aminopeptidase N n=1 Tax=Uliginosibacterium silvisoli TaxID=3114758 RepID=A0ABU6JZ55_9RHOO|nr:aminopeptidase N [Uliginosibacterium sp. H3]